MNDDQLHRLLCRHPARIRLPESFCRAVYARIAAARSKRSFGAGFRGRGRAFITWISRHRLKLLVMALFLALGWALGCGWLPGGPAHW